MIFRFILELFAVGLVCYGVYAQAQRGRPPVKFKSYDELNAVIDVTIWAQKKVGRDDPRQKSLLPLRSYLPLLWMTPLTTRISVKDLEVLAPFIDQFIDGKGPPPVLSAEYDDGRPAALRDFKGRMKIEGLWPKERLQQT
jgi:hypothetical protein